MTENQIILAFIFILLALFTYFFFNYRKFNFSYHILTGLVNLWCISVFIYITYFTDYNNSFSIFSICFTGLFHIIHPEPSKIPVVVSTAVVWIFTVVNILACFSGIGALLLFFTQPFIYAFGFYLLKVDKKTIKIPVIINLLITWGLFFLTASWILNH